MTPGRARLLMTVFVVLGVSLAHAQWTKDEEKCRQGLSASGSKYAVCRAKCVNACDKDQQLTPNPARDCDPAGGFDATTTNCIQNLPDGKDCEAKANALGNAVCPEDGSNPDKP